MGCMGVLSNWTLVLHRIRVDEFATAILHRLRLGVGWAVRYLLFDDKREVYPKTFYHSYIFYLFLYCHGIFLYGKRQYRGNLSCLDGNHSFYFAFLRGFLSFVVCLPFVPRRRKEYYHRLGIVDCCQRSFYDYHYSFFCLSHKTDRF